MSSTVTYKGSTLTTVENQTRILNTRGTWLEDNITITDVTQNSGTPAISVVDTEDSHGGTVRTITALDISDTTAVAADVAQGKYFYTAQGIKTPGTASGGGSSDGQTATGTVTGSGTTVLQIPCSFEPDLIHLYADLTGDASLRGITTLTIIKDVALYQTQDGSTGSANESTVLIRDITGYNESDTTTTHASYSNGTLTIDTVTNSAGYRFAEGITYSYELSTVGTGGSSTPSATSHSIYFEFSDGTDTTLTYYDNEGTFINSAITATTPTTYGGKTVTLAQLDGVAWYTKSTETWETLAEGSTNINADTPYNYIWLADLSDIYPSANDVFRITINSTEYIITAKQASTSLGNIICVGNPKYTGGTDDSSTVPFNFYNAGWGAWVADTEISAPQSVTIKIERLTGIPLNTQLVDYTAVRTGYAVDNDGTIVAGESWECVTDYIAIDPTMTFTFVCKAWYGIGFYDTNKNVLTGYIANDIGTLSGETVSGTITSSIMPSNAAYCVLTGSPYTLTENNLSLIRTA